jgi:hypothetical protein
VSDARIQAFRDALREDDHADAVAGFDAFADALAAQDRREGALRSLARGLNARTDSDAAQAAAQEYLDVVGDAQQLRLQSKYDFMLYLEGGPSADDVADKVDAVITAHDAVAAAAADLREYGDAVDLPPLVGVFGPDELVVPKGSTIDATYTVENVGTSEVGSLDVTVEGYDLSASPTSVGPLAATESADVSVAGTADEAGEFPVVVRASTGDAGESRRTSLAVLDTADYLERAVVTIGDVREQLDQIRQGSGKGKSGGVPNGLVSKLDTAEQRIEQIQAVLDSGGNGKGGNGKGGNGIDQRIGAVANLVDAFGNQARGLGGNRLSERRAAMLQGDASEIVGLLEAAIEAAE